MKNSNDIQDGPRQKHSFLKRLFLITTFFVIALLAGGVFLMRYQGEQKQKELIERAEVRYINIQRQEVRLFSLPFAWAVRKELIRYNYDQIEEYFNELIKRKEFGIIMLADPSGIIKVSTDRKLQGSSIYRSYPGMSLGNSDLVSYPVTKGKSLFLVPVMGLNGKIGTIFFTYTYQELLLP
ncbi:MAG: hypothetical protein NT163_10205 [Chlorobiales bacterium]|nr:hypothetical protein [Chlorobiales bacterium]